MPSSRERDREICLVRRALEKAVGLVGYGAMTDTDINNHLQRRAVALHARFSSAELAALAETGGAPEWWKGDEITEEFLHPAPRPGHREVKSRWRGSRACDQFMTEKADEIAARVVAAYGPGLAWKAKADARSKIGWRMWSELPAEEKGPSQHSRTNHARRSANWG